MVAVSPTSTPKLTLKDAESKLLSFDRHEATNDVSLRRAFLQPPGIAAEDVIVQYQVCTNRGKTVAEVEQAQNALMDHCVQRLAKAYSAESADDARLVLKIYLVTMSTGNRQDRIYASETGNGHVKLTIAWTLALPDGSVVLDGGRIHENNDHLYGLGDMLYVASGERTLYGMANRMCDKILKQTNIASRNPGWCGL